MKPKRACPEHVAVRSSATLNSFSRLSLNSPRGCLRGSPGVAPLERLLQINPVTASIFRYLASPDILSLRNTSREIRHLVGFHPRFLSNLVLIKSGHEQWEEAQGPGNSMENMAGHPEVLTRRLLEEWREEIPAAVKENEWRKLALKYIVETVQDLEGGSDIIKPYWQEEYREIAQTCIDQQNIYEHGHNQRSYGPGLRAGYFPRLRGCHLMWLLHSKLPSLSHPAGSVLIGTLVTTLVLDGTGVDTEALKKVLTLTRHTLKGLSTKWYQMKPYLLGFRLDRTNEAQVPQYRLLCVL